MITPELEAACVGDPVPATGAPDAEAVRAELQRVLASDAFSNAPVLSRFLRYVVEQGLQRPATTPKEYTVGVDVFERGADFDPRVDTIVRVHARRLRKRLGRYYQQEGRTDPLRIAIPKGHYHAEIDVQAAAAEVAPVGGAPVPVSSRPLEGRAWRVTFRSNVIPAPRTSLVGRTGEIAELCDLLTGDDRMRLVTLTGTAGSGKTRLAIEVGSRLQEQLGREAVFVRLAGITDAQMLQLALLRAFGLRTAGDTPPIEILCRSLHALEQPPLLVLDNFEQLATAAPLIGSVLDACVALRVLVTSRVPLRLYGECEYPVVPLALPTRDAMRLKELAAVAAVELFVQRAAAARPGFSLTAENAAAVARICRCFDGLPLGIELAAAQCRGLLPSGILERFPAMLDVPAPNIADVPARHRTLRRAIEWSYGLLAGAEQKLFCRLSVFAGGFTLEAAEAVVDVRGDLGIDVAGGIDRLRHASLLEAVAGTGEPRCAMLDTLREYGLERLQASGEGDDIRKAHAAYCLVLAEEGLARLDPEAREQWLMRCSQERDNFRVALDGLVEQGQGQWALRLVRALCAYWEHGEFLLEACQSLGRVLDRFEPGNDPSLWTRVACCAGEMEGRVGRREAARAHIERGLAVARESGDQALEVMALTSLAVWHGSMQHYAQAAAVFEDCLVISEASGSATRRASALSNLAVARLALGEHQQAAALLERALGIFRRQREYAPAAWCLNQLGDAAMVAGRDADAGRFYHESAERFQQLGNVLGLARCWTDLGELAVLRGAYGEAASLFADTLRLYTRRGFQRGVTNLLEGCAALEVARQRHAEALTLAAAAAAVRSGNCMVPFPYKRARLAEALAPARQALAAAQIKACERRGAAMDARRAIEYLGQCLALSAPDATGAR